MWCFGGLGLPLSRVLRRLTAASLVTCLALFAVLASAAFADEPLASAASDPTAAAEPPPAVPPPAPEPAAQDPAPPPPADTPADQPSDQGPAIEPIVDPVTVDPTPIQALPDPGTAIDLPPSVLDPSTGAGPPRSGTPAAVDAPYSPPALAPLGVTAPMAAAPVAPAPGGPGVGGVVIPEVETSAPVAWKWPAPVHLDGKTDTTVAAALLSSAPPVLSVPSGVPPSDAATRTHRSAESAPAPSLVETLPDPWSPGAPGAPAAAGAAAPGGPGGGFGGLFFAAMFIVALALAAPQRGLSRLARSPVLVLRPVYAPARAPPGS
jgi:hypothetical protein